MAAIESWMDQQGALIGARDAPCEMVDEALAAALVDLGFSRGGGPVTAADLPRTFRDPLELAHYRRERRSCVGVRVNRAVARALTIRLAARLAEAAKHGRELATDAVAVSLHVRVVYRAGRKPACSCDCYETAVEPKTGAIVPVRPSALEKIEWTDEWLDTDKPWKIAEYSLGQALDTWFGASVSEDDWHWLTPPSVGDPRLDALLLALRSGATVERTVVAGREGLRVRERDGTVTTSFLSVEQLAALRSAYGADL